MPKIENESGSCEFSIEGEEGDEFCHIYNLFVKPEHRRKGKAKALITAAINKIRNLGWTGEIQVVAEPTEPSMSKDILANFYKKMGLTVYEGYF